MEIASEKGEIHFPRFIIFCRRTNCENPFSLFTFQRFSSLRKRINGLNQFLVANCRRRRRRRRRRETQRYDKCERRSNVPKRILANRSVLVFTSGSDRIPHENATFAPSGIRHLFSTEKKGRSFTPTPIPQTQRRFLRDNFHPGVAL